MAEHMLQASLQAQRSKGMKQEATHADQLQLLLSQLKEITREKEAALAAHQGLHVQIGRAEAAASESSGRLSALSTRLAAAEVRQRKRLWHSLGPSQLMLFDNSCTPLCI